MTQESAIMDLARNNPEVKDLVEEEGPWKTCILNPCSYDYVFEGVKGGWFICSFV